MKELLGAAASRLIKYMESLPERRVFPAASVLDDLSVFSGNLQEEPIDPMSVLDELDNFGSAATVATNGGRYFGFVIGGVHPAAQAANILAGGWDQNAGLEITSPVGAELEKVCKRWLVDLLGLHPEMEIGFVSGATMANFTALAAARHALLMERGWDVEARGLFGAPPIEVIIGEEVHVSVLKALSLLGFGRERVIRVSVDNQGRIIPESIPEINRPAIVCLQAGNVNTGAFDPIDKVASKIDGTGTWLHIDAAFGLWAQVSPSKRYLIRGLDKADSIATDAHKWINVPYDSGLVFVRNKQHLNSAMAASAAYLEEGMIRDPHLTVPELSRRARAIEIWAVLRSLGKSGLADLIDRCCTYARDFADGILEAGYEVLNDIVLNQVLVSFGSPDVTREVISGVQKEGTCWCGGTVWQGRTAMRISVSSWATTESDVRKSLDAIIKIAKEVH